MLQKLFVNTVSASLIRSPDFKQADDPVRIEIVNIANKLSSYDPEFILKVWHTISLLIDNSAFEWAYGHL